MGQIRSEFVETQVVFVSSDGVITPADALQDQFSARISILNDLPTQNAQEILKHDLRELVDEVQALRTELNQIESN